MILSQPNQDTGMRDPSPCTASGRENISAKGQAAGWGGGEVAGWVCPSAASVRCCPGHLFPVGRDARPQGRVEGASPHEG